MEIKHRQGYYVRPRRQGLTMSELINGPGEEVMHSIGIKLYPNYLPGYEETYIARTVNDASLSIDDVCTSLTKRGGFTGE